MSQNGVAHYTIYTYICFPNCVLLDAVLSNVKTDRKKYKKPLFPGTEWMRHLRSLGIMASWTMAC